MLRTMITSAFLASSAMAVHASTVSLETEDFTFSGGFLQGGNCPVAGPCLALNTNDLVTMSYSGGAFTITSFMYTLQGPAEILATAFDGAVTSGTYTGTSTGNSQVVYTASPLVGFADITSIVFDNTASGTLRIEGFAGSAPAPIPLPAGILLMLTALGGTAMVGRRKRA